MYQWLKNESNYFVICQCYRLILQQSQEIARSIERLS